MNTCTFEVPIPDWVNWIAQDDDGSWWGFKDKPKPGSCGEWDAEDNFTYLCVKGTSPKNWKDELYEWK